MKEIRGRADYYAEGDFNAACSMCGRKRKASELVKNWQGQYRCPEHNEPRQPQDFVRGVQDIQATPWVQTQTDIDVTVCAFNDCSAIPGYAIPGCSTPGRANLLEVEGDLPFYPLTDPTTGQVITTLPTPQANAPPKGEPILVELDHAGQIIIP